jgi:hypothetical protein
MKRNLFNFQFPGRGKIPWVLKLSTLLALMLFMNPAASGAYFAGITGDNPPQLSVSGTIADASTGEALVGVSIRVKATTIGVISDSEGKYSINLPDPKASLIFSFIGYKTQELTTNGRTRIDVNLEVDVTGLDEVVVVGYGTQKKSDITGTVTSLPKGRLENVPNINVAQAIQGSVPGIMIQQSSAGAAPSEVIMIRGRNSILADNSPLIVVDGIP